MVNEINNFFKPFGISLIKSIRRHAVHIEHTGNTAIPASHRDNNFRAGMRIAGNVAGKLLHIRYHHGFLLVNACPANPFMSLKYLAGERSLVGFDGEFPRLQKIETCPGKLIHFMMEHRNNSGHACIRIGRFGH